MNECPAPADGLSTLLGSIDIGDIGLDPCLQLDATGDEFMQWLESFQECDVPLPVDDPMTSTAQEAGSTESSHVAASSSQAGSGSVGDDKPARRQSRGRATATDKVDRLEKVREKNRLAQARFRQKRRQELELAESQVQSVKQKLADAMAKCRAARGLHNTLSNRVTVANSELVSVLQGHNQQPATASFPRVDLQPTPPVTADAPMLAPALVAQTYKGSHSLLPCSAARSVLLHAERPLSSFRHSATLSPEDIQNEGCMVPGADGFINLRDTVQGYKNAIAKRREVIEEDICWFFQTPYSVDSGRHVSFSSTLSSDQCCASFFIYFMASSLENTLVSAELDRLNGVLDDGDSISVQDPLSCTPAIQPFETGPSLGGGRKRSRGTAGEAFASSLMRQPLLDPSDHSKLVRCGVNESCDVASALGTVIGGLLREARSHMPRAQWLKCCRLYLRFVDQVAGRSEDADDGLPDYSQQELPEQAGAAGGHGGPASGKCFGSQVAIMLQTVCDATASAMQEEAPEGASPASEERRRHLLQRVERTGTSWGMSWYCLMTDAKRMVRYLVTETVGPQRVSFDQTELMHIRVYKDMKFSMEQRRFMSDFWSQWERRRRALDGELAAVQERLNSLPSAADLDANLLLRVSSAASGAGVLSPSRLQVDVPWELLGLSPDATHASSTALEALVELHHRDSRQMEDFIAAFALPSWFLSSAQRMKFCCGHVTYGGLPVDLLMLFQAASNQLRREALFSRRPATAVIRGGAA